MSLPTHVSESFRKLHPEFYAPQGSPATPQNIAEKHRLRQKRTPTLNKTEQAFLEHLQATFDISCIYVQDLKLGIGNGVTYTPDFVIWDAVANQYIAYEVKGFMREDAAVKIKVAARVWRGITFVLVHLSGRTGQWRYEQVLP